MGTNTFTVGDVLAGRTPAAVRDKVYITARVTVTEGSRLTVSISLNGPVVWLSEKYRREYGHPEDLLVPDMQTGLTRTRHPELYLVSAGAFLWAGGKLVLLRKDPGAPTCAGCLTEPAGRCDALPGLTAMRELNEELLVLNEEWRVVERSYSMAALAFVHGGYISLEHAKRIKTQQLTARSPHPVAIEYVDLDCATHGPRMTEKDSDFTCIVDVYVDDVFMETIRGPHFFDIDHNTLEIRLALDLRYAGLNHCRFQDGEEYNRAVQLYTIEELLKGELLTPCLDHYARLFQRASQEAALATLPFARVVEPTDSAARSCAGYTLSGAGEQRPTSDGPREDLPDALREDERQRCEVWTRVMGYHRPTAEFNEGKKAEFAERVFFRESLIPKEVAEGSRVACHRYALEATKAREEARAPRIYMAGPLFSLAERNHNMALAAALMRLMPDALCVLPQRRAEVLLPDLAAVSADCVEQASTCDVLVACLDGPDVDSGTCMEIVHARAHGHPVIGYRTDFRGSEVEGVNAMVRYGVDIYVFLPAYETGIDALAGSLADHIRQVLP